MRPASNGKSYEIPPSQLNLPEGSEILLPGATEWVPFEGEWLLKGTTVRIGPEDGKRIRMALTPPDDIQSASPGRLSALYLPASEGGGLKTVGPAINDIDQGERRVGGGDTQNQLGLGQMRMQSGNQNTLGQSPKPIGRIMGRP